MKRAALYVRVSTEEQKKHGLSVDSQIVALRQYCKDNGYSEVGLYNDAGISARKKYTKRPELLRLIDDCKAKKVDIILFTKLDRWFRSVADYYQVQAVLDQNKIAWRAIWEDYETETSSGVFKVNIMLSVAQSEADRTSERIKSVNEYKREQGGYVGGKAPTGYMISKHDLLIDESKKEAVSSFFSKYLSTFSLHEAILTMRENGVTVCHDTAARMLKNKTYAGDAYGYKCEAYITQEQYDLIQASSATRHHDKGNSQKGTYYFTGGLFRCACCGSAMTGSTRSMPSGKTTKRYKFYKCTSARNLMCDNKATISEMRVESFLLSNIERIIDGYNTSIEYDIKTHDKANDALKRLQLKLDRIGIRFEEGDITVEEYRSKKADIKAEMDAIMRETKPKTKKAIPANWREVYNELDDSHRRAFWYQTVRKLEYNQDGSINVVI